MGYGADYSELGINRVEPTEHEDGPAVRPGTIKLQWEKMADALDRLARTIEMVEKKSEDVLTPRTPNAEAKLASGEASERERVVSPMALNIDVTTRRLHMLNEKLSALLSRIEL